jgi:class 3 adenylate cyclase
MVSGNSTYMSPEEAGAQTYTTIDGRADLYSLGVVLYEMLAGLPPSDSPMSMGGRGNAAPQSPCAINPALAAYPQLCAVVMKCLQKDPNLRYANAAEMRAALQEIETSLPAKSDASAATVTAAAHPGSISEPVFTTSASRLAPVPAPVSRSAPAPAMEMAHVLFMDIVGYSRLPVDRQAKMLRQLQEVVVSTREYREARPGELIVLPTGDGMALCFFGSPEAPALSAMSIALSLRKSNEIPLRMGLHSGPVYRVRDIKDNINVAGGGINYAQRVMDCGDAGHILASGAIADVLTQHSTWSPCLHELGLAEVKHGLRIRVFNLHTNEVGNAAVPVKLSTAATDVPAAQKRTKGADAVSPITLELLEKTTKKLAGYIGPIAGIVVKRTAKKCSSAQELYLCVAEEIKSSEDRDRFLTSLGER